MEKLTQAYFHKLGNDYYETAHHFGTVTNLIHVCKQLLERIEKLEGTTRRQELSEEDEAEIKDFANILVRVDGLPPTTGQMAIISIIVESLRKWEMRKTRG